MGETANPYLGDMQTLAGHAGTRVKERVKLRVTRQRQNKIKKESDVCV